MHPSKRRTTQLQGKGTKLGIVLGRNLTLSTVLLLWWKNWRTSLKWINKWKLKVWIWLRKFSKFDPNSPWNLWKRMGLLRDSVNFNQSFKNSRKSMKKSINKLALKMKPRMGVLQKQVKILMLPLLKSRKLVQLIDKKYDGILDKLKNWSFLLLVEDLKSWLWVLWFLWEKQS